MQKISVIIPIHNTEEFLVECIDSVLQQSFENFEIILIDDASDHKCRETIEEQFKRDERIKLFRFNERKGVGSARNFGIEKATGDYIYFLDSDDFISSDTFSLMMEFIGDFPVLAGEIVSTHKREGGNSLSINTELLRKKSIEIEQFHIVSALHMLISKDYISSYQLRFSDNIELYSDLSFLFPILLNNHELNVLNGCFYYKRLRNDPISNPSLLQMEGIRKITDFLQGYNFLREKYYDSALGKKFLDDLLLNLYSNGMINLLEEEKLINESFPELSNSFKKVDPARLKKVNFFIRGEVSALKAGNIEKFKKKIKLHRRIKQVRWALQGRTKFYIQLYRSFLTKLPMKENTIVFESFLGKSYSDSPKYIYEYMLQNKMDYKFVWIFKQPGKKIPGDPKQVKRFSFRYYYYLATSKYWISNSRMPLHLSKREGNIYIQTWHGTPLKKLVFDMAEIHSADPNYKKIFYQQSRRWDYLLSPNQYSSEIFRRAFKFEKKMLEFGYPRNDILYNPNQEEYAKSIKTKLGIPLDKKVILYAPTWRDDEYYGPGKYKFQLKLNLEEMQEHLGEEYIILLRMHYFIANNIDTANVNGFAYNLSKYDDIAELYLISDLLITDYSSVFFDYANLQRPILFYTYDLEKYRDTLRGFYINIEEDVPGPLLKTTNEVINAIKNIDMIQEEYKDRYDKFYNRFCEWDDGKASEKVVNTIFKN